MTYRLMHSRILGGRRLAQIGVVATPDVTAPTLSNPTDVADGGNMAAGAVSTNEGNGTLYWVVTQSATSPSKAQVKAGQDHTSATADAEGAQAVTAIGAQAVAASGLTAETSYFMHFLQEDAAGNQSDIASADGFTTAASGGAPWLPSDGADTQSWFLLDDDGGSETNRSIRSDSGVDYLTDVYDQIGSNDFSQTTGSKQLVISGTGSGDDDNGNDVATGAYADTMRSATDTWGTTSFHQTSSDRWSVVWAHKAVSGRSQYTYAWGIHNGVAKLGVRIGSNGDVSIVTEGSFPSGNNLPAGTISDDTWHVYALHFDGTDIEVRIDGGAAIASRTPGGSPQPAAQMNFGSRTAGASTNQNLQNGFVSDLIISDADYAFSGGDEGEKLEGYLAHKVGATLDSGHTYAASAP